MMRSTSASMIFLPLTVPATVLSGVLLVDEHAAPTIAIKTANNRACGARRRSEAARAPVEDSD
jgi:hypothetical protein